MRITGILPVKNGERWITPNLPFIMANLGPHDNLVVIENGSTDDSVAILESFAAEDSRIQIIKTGDVGLVKALNLGIGASDNPWIARFDIDDFYPTTRINHQKKLITENTSAIFADYQIKNQFGKNLGTILSPIFDLSTKASLIRSERTAHPVALLNRAAVVECGGYSQDEFPAEDLGLWARLSDMGSIVSIPSVELEYRINANSISTARRKEISRLSMRMIKSYNLNRWCKAAYYNLGDTLELYDHISDGNLRKLLHLRDLRHEYSHKVLTKDQNRVVNTLFLKLLYNPTVTRAIPKLVKEKFLREFYRVIV